MSALNGQVRARRFSAVRLGGYDAQEVDRVVEELESTVRANEEAVTTLQGQLAMFESLLNEADADNARLRAAADAAAADAAAIAVAEVSGTGSTAAEPVEHSARSASQAAARLLEIATRDADELIAQVRVEAAGILAAAREDAEHLRQESARRVSEAQARLARLGVEERDGRERLVAQLEVLLATVRGTDECGTDEDGEKGELVLLSGSEASVDDAEESPEG